MQRKSSLLLPVSRNSNLCFRLCIPAVIPVAFFKKGLLFSVLNSGLLPAFRGLEEPFPGDNAGAPITLGFRTGYRTSQALEQLTRDHRQRELN